MKGNKRQCAKTPSPKPQIEVADIFDRYGEDFKARQRLTWPQKRIMEDIINCRTLAMGGHDLKCDVCGHVEISYNSCRNRHCPKCQSLKKARWLEDRVADLLPVAYVHGVFTLPHDLNPVILYNKKLILDALFRLVNQTLQEFARDKRNGLEGDLGVTALLHTWNQKLFPHYHLHCIIPAGAFRPHENTWIPTRYRFLFPVKALSKVLRGKMVGFLRKAYRKNALCFPGRIANLQEPEAFEDLLNRLMAINWVVYAKAPFKSPKFVLDYLGRYTHRVAISNHRILSMDNNRIRFTFKNRDKGYQTEVCQLTSDQFIKRFLCHEIPSGFTRIRHFGFLGNSVKTKRLNAIRILLGEAPVLKPKIKKTDEELMLEYTGIDITLCPKCQKGRMKMIAQFEGIYSNPYIAPSHRKAG